MIEFLNEDLTKDELVFYLHSRFLLNHGPMLLKEANWIQKIIFIEMEWVMEFLDILLAKMDGGECSKIMRLITEEAKKDTELW